MRIQYIRTRSTR